MDSKPISDLIGDNSIVGAAGVTALAILYKIWKILKRDRKEDNLSDAERALRDEIRQDAKDLRASYSALEKTHRDDQLRIIELSSKLSTLESACHICKANHPENCPLTENCPLIKHFKENTNHDATN